MEEGYTLWKSDLTNTEHEREIRKETGMCREEGKV
jgi:hypothetical protein